MVPIYYHFILHRRTDVDGKIWRRKKEKPFICVKLWWCTLMALERINGRCEFASVCAHALTVGLRVRSCVGVGACLCSTMDGGTKSLRQAECMMSVCYIRLSSVCVCVREWMEETQIVAEPRQPANHCPRRCPLPLLSYRLRKSNMQAEEEASQRNSVPS